MKNNLVVFLVFLIITFVFCGAASATTDKNIQINTDKNSSGSNFYKQENPAISGTRIVWEQQDYYTYYKYHSTVYVKNIGTGSYGKVFKSIGNQYNPDISGTRVVWEQKTLTGSTAIYMKNLVTGYTGRVSLSTKNQYNPSISGTRVVWEQRDTTGHSSIYYKNIAFSGSYKVFKTTNSQFSPDISGTRIVWNQLTGNLKTVYVKNMATGKISILTYNSSLQYSIFNSAPAPYIDGTRVVWEQTNSSGKSVFYVKNLITGVVGKITPTEKYSLLSCFDGVRVVWIDEQSDMEVGNIYFIYVKNLVTGVKDQLSLFGYHYYPSAAISDNRVVWSNLLIDGYNIKLMVENLVTHKSGQVTPN